MDSDVLYREAAQDDLGAVIGLVEKVFRSDFDVPIEEAVSRELAETAARHEAARSLILTAMADGRPVGALVGIHEGADERTLSLTWLAVDPAWRGRGIGHELVSRALEACDRRGITVVKARTLAASAVGPRLYWSFGFRVCDVVSRSLGGRPREVLLYESRRSPASG